MVAQVTGGVTGVPQALKELGKLDPLLRRQLAKQMRAPVEPLKQAARSKLPSQPLSNWTTGRYAYDQGKARSGVQVKIGGRGGSSGGTSLRGLIGASSITPLLSMTQRNAGGAVYDMAGRRSSGKSPQGRTFVAGLNRSGSASRSMWAAAEEKMPEVEKAAAEAALAVSAEINARLRL